MEHVKANLLGLRTVKEPREGRQVIQFEPLNFVTGAEQFKFNSDSIAKDLSGISTVWVDATGVTQGKNVYLVNQLQRIVVPGGKQGYYAVTDPMPFNFDITADAGLIGTLKINLYNFEVLPGESQTIQTVSGAITANQGAASAAPWNMAISDPVPVEPKDAATIFKVVTVPAAGFVTGQQAVNNVAAALPDAASKKVIVRALSANAASVFIGVAGVTIATGFELKAGESITLEVTNANLIYVIAAAAGGSVCYIVI